jgi:hypothetical protein
MSDASQGKPLTKRRLDNLDESDTELGWIDAVRNPEGRERRIVKAFTRLALKLQFCLYSQRLSRVVAHWETAAQPAAVGSEATATRVKTARPRQRLVATTWAT